MVTANMLFYRTTSNKREWNSDVKCTNCLAIPKKTQATNHLKPITSKNQGLNSPNSSGWGQTSFVTGANHCTELETPVNAFAHCCTELATPVNAFTHCCTELATPVNAFAHCCTELATPVNAFTHCCTELETPVNAFTHCCTVTAKLGIMTSVQIASLYYTMLTSNSRRSIMRGHPSHQPSITPLQNECKSKKLHGVLSINNQLKLKLWKL